MIPLFVTQAVESESQELELDLSSLGAVNTMFAALFRFGCFFYCLFILQDSLLLADSVKTISDGVLCINDLRVSKLGVPIKTTVSATVLEEALNGMVTVRPLPLGQPITKKV